MVGGQPSPALDLRAGFVDPPWWSTAEEYAGLGFTHTLPKGLDHILFVLGLSASVRAGVWFNEFFNGPDPKNPPPPGPYPPPYNWRGGKS